MNEIDQDVEHVRAVTEALGGNTVWCVDEEIDGNNENTQIFWSREGALAFLASQVYVYTRNWKEERREAVSDELKSHPDRWSEGDDGGACYFSYERTIRP